MSRRRLLSLLLLCLMALGFAPALVRAQEAPPAGCIYVETDPGFETDDAWTFTETASPGFFDATVAYAGERAAFVGIPEDAENQEVDSTVWQRMRLPVAGQITMSAQLRSQEGDGDDARYIVVWDLTTDESTILLYEQVFELDWQPTTVDLTAFAGKDVLLVFGVHNDGRGKKAAMWVDEARVLACDLQSTTASPIDAPTVAPFPSPTATATSTPLPSPTPTPLPTDTPTPTATPTATATPPPTSTPTPTSSPSPTPTPTLELRLTPRSARGSLPDNNALPLAAAIMLSGMVALVVVVISLRR